MLELVGQLRANLEERFQRLLGERTTPQAKLAAFIDAHLGVGEGEDREAVACWVTIGTEALRQPEILEAYREQMSEQKSRLCSWLEELSSDGAEEKAAAILAAVEGCYQLAAAVPELTPPGFAAPTVRKMVEGLIGTNL